MTDLEDLAEIADVSAFGYTPELSQVGTTGHRRAKPPLCGSPDHMQGKNIRIWHSKGRKTRTICKLCDRAREKARDRGRYEAEGYPL